MDSGWLAISVRFIPLFSFLFLFSFILCVCVWSFSKWFPFVSIWEMKRKCFCFLLLLKYSMALIWFSSPISEWNGSEKSWQTATEAAHSTAKGGKGRKNIPQMLNDPFKVKFMLFAWSSVVVYKYLRFDITIQENTTHKTHKLEWVELVCHLLLAYVCVPVIGGGCETLQRFLFEIQCNFRKFLRCFFYG